MNQEKFRVYLAVGVILEKEDQILLLRRHATGFKDGFYSLVCGHLEEGEGSTAAIVRETKEEVGVQLEPQDLMVAHITHRKDSDRNCEYIDIFFIAKSWQGEPVNQEPDKCDEMKWFHKNDLPTAILPNTKFALEEISKKHFYGEFGW